MPEPKIVANLTTGAKIYWCQKTGHQMVEMVCHDKYFSKRSKKCRVCLGLVTGDAWPEPWDRIGKEDEQINILEVN